MAAGRAPAPQPPTSAQLQQQQQTMAAVGIPLTAMQGFFASGELKAPGFFASGELNLLHDVLLGSPPHLFSPPGWKGGLDAADDSAGDGSPCAPSSRASSPGERNSPRCDPERAGALGDAAQPDDMHREREVHAAFPGTAGAQALEDHTSSRAADGAQAACEQQWPLDLQNTASMPLPQHISSQASGSLEAALHGGGIPTNVATPDGVQVSLSPVLWRDFATQRLMVNVGLRTAPLQSDSVRRTFYTTLNPRVVTTGVPARPRQHPYRRPKQAADAATYSMATRSASAPASLPRAVLGLPASGSQGAQLAKRDKELIIVKEVWLLRKNPKSLAIEEVWNGQGPLEGGTVPDTPAWPGRWYIDLVVKVSDGEEQEWWIGAMNRTIDAATAERSVASDASQPSATAAS